MNPVFVYLNNNIGIKYSVRTMSRNLNIKRRACIFYCYKDPRIRKVNGNEVGSGKNKLSVFTIDP